MYAWLCESLSALRFLTDIMYQLCIFVNPPAAVLPGQSPQVLVGLMDRAKK
jgi:hypothetical protein